MKLAEFTALAETASKKSGWGTGFRSFACRNHDHVAFFCMRIQPRNFSELFEELEWLRVWNEENPTPDARPTNCVPTLDSSRRPI